MVIQNEKNGEELLGYKRSLGGVKLGNMNLPSGVIETDKARAVQSEKSSEIGSAEKERKPSRSERMKSCLDDVEGNNEGIFAKILHQVRSSCKPLTLELSVPTDNPKISTLKREVRKQVRGVFVGLLSSAVRTSMIFDEYDSKLLTAYKSLCSPEEQQEFLATHGDLLQAFSESAADDIFQAIVFDTLRLLIGSSQGLSKIAISHMEERVNRFPRYPVLIDFANRCMIEQLKKEERYDESAKESYGDGQTWLVRDYELIANDLRSYLIREQDLSPAQMNALEMLLDPSHKALHIQLGPKTLVTMPELIREYFVVGLNRSRQQVLDKELSKSLLRGIYQSIIGSIPDTRSDQLSSKDVERMTEFLLNSKDPILIATLRRLRIQKAEAQIAYLLKEKIQACKDKKVLEDLKKMLSASYRKSSIDYLFSPS